MLAVLVRFIAIPYFDPTAKVNFSQFITATLDTFMISLVITVFIGTFIFWLTPEIVKKSEMEIVNPKEINPLFKKAVTDTKTWIIKGACGRYTRAATLPTLASAAKHEGIGRDIRMIMLDPSNIEVCDEYATYRRSLKSSSSRSPWTLTKVQEEVIATIISALQYKYTEPLLTINIHLANVFSAFRLDISDHYVIVTKEDKEAAGLRADAGTYFYNSYKDETRLIERQSKEVIYHKPIVVNNETTEENLKSLILDVGLVSEEIISKLEIKNILSYILDPVEPYTK